MADRRQNAVRTIRTVINGRPVRRATQDHRTVAEFLREDLGLTGTKVSCETQVCGSCTVLLDGAPISSCCTLVHEIDGRTVLTVEGLSDGDELHPVQDAFVEHLAFQCGFCTPGMVLTAVALLDEHADPDADTIRSALAGNLCRCTGYVSIVAAVQAAARRRRGRPAP